MSVIIRLQNLPWNANALDIRRYFQGLSIPDGGVHIIGGEKGDAFIAFSTDEDARQAMMKDSGRINGFAVKLLLSSKTEMQNVISTAKDYFVAGKAGPPPPAVVPASISVPKPAGFYERTLVPPVGGAPVPFVGGSGGDVTGSGQGLRSSTGLGSLPVPFGYPPPGNSAPVIPAQPAGSMVRMNEPRAVPGAATMPLAQRSMFDARPSDRPPVPGSLPPAAPMDSVVPGFPPPPIPPAAGSWASVPPPMNHDLPPLDFVRPADIPGNQGVGFNTFNPSAGREPMRMDGRQLDPNYARNGQAYGGAPESGRNFIPGIEAGRNLSGPPPDMGRGEFGRGDMPPLGRPEEQRDPGRDPGRIAGDTSRWADRDAGRQENASGQGWSGGGRSFSGRDTDSDSRRDFARPDVDPGLRAPDRWMDNRNMGTDRGPRDPIFSDGPPPRQRPEEPYDRYGPGRPSAFPEASGSRFGPDSGHHGMGGIPEDRPRDVPRAPFPHPEPGNREPPHRLMDEHLRPPPLPEQRWMDDRRGYGPPGPGGPPPPRFEGRPMSPPRDRFFPGDGYPPRDDQWQQHGHRFDPRQMRDPGTGRDLCVCAVNFPRTFNYREVRRFFKGCEIPRDGVKLINNRDGMRTGVVFVRFTDVRSFNVAFDRNGNQVGENRINIERCSDEDFDTAIDGAPPKRVDRSRSPRRHAEAEGNQNISYFVLKKLPLKTEKEDIRKFFGKFRIASDGGPFFELAFDKTPTGNALVAVEEKEYSKVLALHRTSLNGARIDVIKIESFEFQERSRRARQCEREVGKDAGQSKSSTTQQFAARDKKVEKQDQKSKEPERSGNVPAEEDGRAYCMEMRGVPYTASPPIIQDFFHGIDILPENIHVVYNREHRATGIAFIEFNSSTDQKRALEKDKQYMGHRFIELRALSKTAMVEEYNRQQQKFGGTPLPGGRSNSERPKQGSGSGSVASSEALLSMQNLHFDTQLEDILEFFSGYHPIVSSIKLQYKDQHPTGDGLVGFPTVQEAESALCNKNHYLLLGRPVTLSWAKN